MPLHFTHRMFANSGLIYWLLSLLLVTSSMHGLGEHAAHATEESPVEVYRAGTLWPGIGPAIHDAVMIVQGGKVLAVGPRASIEIPADAIEHNLGGQTVIPGLVIAQSALVESSNDSEYTVTPEVRAIDGFDPFDDYKQWIVAGGNHRSTFMTLTEFKPMFFRSLTRRLEDFRASFRNSIYC